MDPIKISEPTGQTPATHGHHKGAKAAAAGVFDRIFSQLGQTSAATSATTLAVAVPVAANTDLPATNAENGEPDILAMLQQQMQTSQSVASTATAETTDGETSDGETTPEEGIENPLDAGSATGEETSDTEITDEAALAEGQPVPPDVAEKAAPAQQNIVAAAVQPAVQAMQQAKAPNNAGGISAAAASAARQVAGQNQPREAAGPKAETPAAKTGEGKSEFKLDGTSAEATPQRGVKSARGHAQAAAQMTDKAKPELTVKQEAPAPLTQQAQPAQPANTQAQPLTNDAPQIDLPTDNQMTEQQQAIDTTDAAWLENLADRIEATFADNGAEADIALTPDNLGSLRIKIEMTEGGAQVTVVAENAEAAKLFTQTEHRLGELLSRSGLQLAGQQAGTDARGDQQAQQSRGGNDTRMNTGHDADADTTAAQSADGSGLVNLIA